MEKSPLKAIRAKCLDCCCGQASEVKNCPSKRFPLWEYRFDGYLQIRSDIILFINPNPFIMPNRLTGAPYLALGNYAIYAYLICLTHVPYILNYTIFDFICQALFSIH